MEKYYSIVVRDEDDELVRDNDYTTDKVDDLGGIGSIVGAIDPLLKDGEYIVVRPYYFNE